MQEEQGQPAAHSGSNASEEGKPWYRYPFVWLVISGPAIVVVAAIYTAIIAHQGADLIVKDMDHARELNAYSDMTDPNVQDPRLMPADKVRKMGQDAHKAQPAQKTLD